MFRDGTKAKLRACAARANGGPIQEISKHLLNLHMTKYWWSHDEWVSVPKLVTAKARVGELFELRERH